MSPVIESMTWSLRRLAFYSFLDLRRALSLGRISCFLSAEGKRFPDGTLFPEGTLSGRAAFGDSTKVEAVIASVGTKPAPLLCIFGF